ncbi:flagellar motor switch protein FliG [Candidatus Epulonipiscium fishelsonii]|uniref:Flagellar motor switch protein FliG n=1 Tax=Candidatus Epulonipiscium fishelsonii TaxID=77094 RepID=A0ACC8XDK9_9FIRM|nr:flagellar motor switch protein FliG [Epulopiscium sp. SCG-B05WGA-EpuloA1]ONI40977.1 flagellar motor switch protein FliG [Epulopiscium sp. SCG-B11WGA-EpuloA1]ONI47329.1 flagellar motor switch protein FliG [Epulopiscium sp. SCG-C06WGA-EpuloA1]
MDEELEDLSSRQKAAMLLISLGPEKSAKIFKYLKEEEIEDLTLEIASIRAISPKLKEAILKEFYEICLAQEYISEGGIGYAKKLLDEALGVDKASDVIGKLTMALQVKPFEFARKTDPAQLINFLQSEHPQTIALILSYLKPLQASSILSSLPSNVQGDIARRISLMDKASPDVVNEIEREFEKRVSALLSEEYATVGGIDAIVEIINMVDRGTEKHIMSELELQEPELADTIKKRMFVFEDIATLDNKSVQRILREVDNGDLAIALKNSNNAVKELIFSNVSKRLAEMIQEELEFMGPKRLKEIEEAQQKIVAIVRKLEEAGEIMIARGSGDDLIV